MLLQLRQGGVAASQAHGHRKHRGRLRASRASPAGYAACMNDEGLSAAERLQCARAALAECSDGADVRSEQITHVVSHVHEAVMASAWALLAVGAAVQVCRRRRVHHVS